MEEFKKTLTEFGEILAGRAVYLEVFLGTKRVAHSAIYATTRVLLAQVMVTIQCVGLLMAIIKTFEEAGGKAE